MNFSVLFNVFSNRSASRDDVLKPLTESFRNRVYMRCQERFAYTNFWNEIHTKLAYLHGKPRLSKANTSSKGDDALEFLFKCSDAHFLDFLEYIFSTQSYHQSSGGTNLVNDLNDFFKQDSLPYAITDFVWVKGNNQGYETLTLSAYPQVIRKDSETLFQTAIQPTLQLLRETKFISANTEFLEALEDFRKADYGDLSYKMRKCIGKCS